MRNKSIQADQLIPTSSTPPPEAGFYRIDRHTIGVVGNMSFRDPNTQVVSRMADINRSALVGKQGAAAFRSAMSSAYQCAAIQVLGDSTGDSSTEWPSLLAAKIANDYPAWTVRVMTFSDATQQYGAPTVIQTGTAGDRYMDSATGTNGRSLSTGQSPHMSGVIDLRMKLRMSSWVPAAQNNVFGKSGNPPNRGWFAFINTAGYLQIAYSTDGTALASINGTAATDLLQTPIGGCAGFSLRMTAPAIEFLKRTKAPTELRGRK